MYSLTRNKAKRQISARMGERENRNFLKEFGWKKQTQPERKKQFSWPTGHVGKFVNSRIFFVSQNSLELDVNLFLSLTNNFYLIFLIDLFQIDCSKWWSASLYLMLYYRRDLCYKRVWSKTKLILKINRKTSIQPKGNSKQCPNHIRMLLKTWR